MAQTITAELNDEREAALVRLTARHNVSRLMLKLEPLTPAQYFRQYVRQDWLDVEVKQFNEAQEARFGVVYRNASPEDRALMDAIRARTPIT